MKVLSLAGSRHIETCAACHVVLYAPVLRCRHCRRLLPTVNRSVAAIAALALALLIWGVGAGLRMS